MGFVNVLKCLAIRAEKVPIKNWNCTVHHPRFCAKVHLRENNTSENIHFKCVGIVSCPISRVITILDCTGQAANVCTKMKMQI